MAQALNLHREDVQKAFFLIRKIKIIAKLINLSQGNYSFDLSFQLWNVSMVDMVHWLEVVLTSSLEPSLFLWDSQHLSNFVVLAPIFHM